jgi:hypothetical protein
MSELIIYLREQQERWLRILNSEYRTDGGTSLQEYAKGRLSAYTELLAYLEEDHYDEVAEETRRATKEIGGGL